MSEMRKWRSVAMVFLCCVWSAASSEHHFKPSHTHLKREHFRLFFLDILNTTDFVIVEGVSGRYTPTTAPFGTVFCINTALTATPVYANDSSSKRSGTPVLGDFVGTSTIASWDGLASLGFVSISLNTSRYMGTLSVMGLFSFAELGRAAPIVGGTGSFLFAQGTATTTPTSRLPTYQIDLHVYWPPYVL